MMNPTDRVLLALRVLTEIGVVLGLVLWGYATGAETGTRVLLAVVAPLVGLGVWGAVDFRQMGRLAEPLRLFGEMVISGLAALALISVGQALLGWILATISVIYHLLVYLTDHRLLTPPRDTAAGVNDRKGHTWTANRSTTR